MELLLDELSSSLRAQLALTSSAGLRFCLKRTGSVILLNNQKKPSLTGFNNYGVSFLTIPYPD